jgi:SAM-dependent methyltransferase
MPRCCDFDGVDRFADRAEVYARGRPSYPPEAIAFVAPDPHSRIVDVGAGTGISTRLLHAIGVDPGLVMMRAGGDVPMIAGRAEALPLRDRCADVVTSFNAFHWFQPEAFFAEARRVLKASGHLALVWNDWDLDDDFTREFVRIMRSEAGDYPKEDRAAEVAPLFATKLFAVIEHRGFPNEHALDLPTLRLRLQSMSYIPREGPVWEALDTALTSLHRRFTDEAGIVRHRYTTNVFLARAV